MFSGIVEGMGRVISVRKERGTIRMTVKLPRGLSGLRTRDSICVNGACLTVTARKGPTFAVDMIPETLRRTTFGRVAPGSLVNLERALAASGRLGGHMVSGHVDGIGMVTRVRTEGKGRRIRISPPAGLMPYLVYKGSSCVEGVSLTVAAVGPAWFEVALIPYTLEETTIGRLRPGSMVNLEADILAKYVEKILAWRGRRKGRR